MLWPKAHARRALGDFSKGKIAVLFAVLMAITSIPILLHPLPPISDYINHLARMHVIATINSDPDLSRYYEIDWQVIPNLMMDLIVPLFERVMNIYLAGAGLYAVELHADPVGHGRAPSSALWTLVRAAADRVSAALQHRLPRRHDELRLRHRARALGAGGLDRAARARPVRCGSWCRRCSCWDCSSATCSRLGSTLVGLLAFETRRLWVGYAGVRRSWGRDAVRQALPALILDFVITGLPFLPVPLLLMLSPTRGLWNFDWQLAGKVSGVTFVIEVYSHEVAFLLTVVIACATGWALHRRALSFHAFGLALLAVGAVAYMALPRVMFDTYMVDQRLPISLAFILVACIDVDFRDRMVRWIFASGLILFLALRVGEVESTWTKLSQSTESFRKSVTLLHRGAKVLVAYDDPDGGDSVEDYGLMHADCIAIIERSALVTTAFTVVGKQVLHARPPYRNRVDTQDGTPPVVDKLVQVVDHEDTNPDDYWRHWTTDYDYLYVLFTDDKSENPDPKRLTEIFAGDRFVLYRIEKSLVTVASKPIK